MFVDTAGTVAMEDRDCLALARQGDVAARERLYVLHVRALMRHARMMLRDPAEAEDLVQDTFAVAFASLRRFRGDSSFTTYLHGIALNLARHHWRRAARTRQAMEAQRASFDRAGDDETRTTERIDADREMKVVSEAMDRLRPKLREAFVLLAVERLPGEEAARVAGVKIEVLRVRATRAKQAVLEEVRRRLGESVSRNPGPSHATRGGSGCKERGGGIP